MNVFIFLQSCYLLIEVFEHEELVLVLVADCEDQKTLSSLQQLQLVQICVLLIEAYSYLC